MQSNFYFENCDELDEIHLRDGPKMKGKWEEIPECCLLESQIECSWLQESEFEVQEQLQVRFPSLCEEHLVFSDAETDFN